ncbi:MAG: hypothetical protein H0U66_11255 [Gemmatimonadaceae bacterium]|nr:hypothetical protein [Gemmatimonadaceae bacterium]
MMRLVTRVSLTARELEVLTMIARGLRNEEVAGEIGRTEETVKMHVCWGLRQMGRVGGDDANRRHVRRRA